MSLESLVNSKLKEHKEKKDDFSGLEKLYIPKKLSTLNDKRPNGTPIPMIERAAASMANRIRTIVEEDIPIYKSLKREFNGGGGNNSVGEIEGSIPLGFTKTSHGTEETEILNLKGEEKMLDINVSEEDIRKARERLALKEETGNNKEVSKEKSQEAADQAADQEKLDREREEKEEAERLEKERLERERLEKEEADKKEAERKQKEEEAILAEAQRIAKEREENEKKNNSAEENESTEETPNLTIVSDEDTSGVIERGQRKKRNLKIVRNNKKYKRVKKAKNDNAYRLPSVLSNSGYIAEVAGLKTMEISALALMNSQRPYDKYSDLYERIFKKMKVDGVRGFTYDNFIKMTSSFEVPLILLSSYKASMAEDYTELDFKCPSCTKEFSHREKNEALLKYDNTSKVEEAVANMKNGTPIEILENSNVNTTITEYLDEGAVIEIRHPSLHHQLEGLREITPELSMKHPLIIEFVPYIERLLVPTGVVDSQGNEEMVEVEELADILEEIEEFDLELIELMRKTIDNFGKQFSYTIGLRNVTCPHCQKEVVKFHELDMEDMLFIIPEQNLKGKQSKTQE